MTPVDFRIVIPRDLHREFKQMALDKDVSMTRLLLDWIQAAVEEHKRQPTTKQR